MPRIANAFMPNSAKAFRTTRTGDVSKSCNTEPPNSQCSSGRLLHHLTNLGIWTCRFDPAQHKMWVELRSFWLEKAFLALSRVQRSSVQVREAVGNGTTTGPGGTCLESSTLWGWGRMISSSNWLKILVRPCLKRTFKNDWEYSSEERPWVQPQYCISIN